MTVLHDPNRLRDLQLQAVTALRDLAKRIKAGKTVVKSMNYCREPIWTGSFFGSPGFYESPEYTLSFEMEDIPTKIKKPKPAPKIAPCCTCQKRRKLVDFDGMRNCQECHDALMDYLSLND